VLDATVGRWVVAVPVSGVELVPVAVGAPDPGDRDGVSDGVRDDDPERTLFVSASSVAASVETFLVVPPVEMSSVEPLLETLPPPAEPLVRRGPETGRAVSAARSGDSSMIPIRPWFSASTTSLSLLHSPWTSFSVSHFRSSASGKRSDSSRNRSASSRLTDGGRSRCHPLNSSCGRVREKRSGEAGMPESWSMSIVLGRSSFSLRIITFPLWRS
jgi:hypothetical protein